jgi:hypothetical protein
MGESSDAIRTDAIRTDGLQRMTPSRPAVSAAFSLQHPKPPVPFMSIARNA